MIVRTSVLGGVFGVLFLGQVCSQQVPSASCELQTYAGKNMATAFPYDLNAPARSIPLPDILREASGLSVAADGRSLWVVQDERGSLFSVSLDGALTVREFPFGEKGDYEGVEVADGQVFVVLSTGTLLQLEERQGVFRVKTTFDTFLNEENNVEGLGYDPARKLLLLACKGEAGKSGTGSGNKKAVYGFEVRSGRILAKPLLCVTGESLRQWTLQENLPQALDAWFNPSGIAVHPKTGEWYILSARDGHLLRVAPKTGEVLGVVSIRKKVLEQPEGICFDASGRLYLATEGKERSARILVFEARPE